MSKKEKERKQNHKEWIHKHDGNKKQGQECEYFEAYNSEKIKQRKAYLDEQNLLLEQVNQISEMIETWIYKYYKGIFTIKYDKNKKIKKLLNFCLGEFIKNGKSAVLKIADEFYVVKINVLMRDSSNNPISISVQGRDSNYSPIAYIIGKEPTEIPKNHKISEKLTLNDIAILENVDEQSINCYISPLKIIAKNLFSAVIKKIGIANLSTIIAIDEKNYKAGKNAVRDLVFSNYGIVGTIILQDIDKIKEFKLTEIKAQDVKEYLDCLITVLNLIKQFLGMRQNENFLSDRNISLGLQNAEIVFSLFEKSIEEAIEYWLDEVKEKLKLEDVVLVKHIEIKVGEQNVTTEKNT